MTSWINADIWFPRHVGNLLLANNYFILVRQGCRWEKFLTETHHWRQVCDIVLKYLDGGKYIGANLWRVYQQMHYSGWYITICHPNCPVVEEGMEIPNIDFNVVQSEREQIQHAMFEYFQTLNNKEK